MTKRKAYIITILRIVSVLFALYMALFWCIAGGVSEIIFGSMWYGIVRVAMAGVVGLGVMIVLYSLIDCMGDAD